MDALLRPGFIIINLSLLFLIFLIVIVARMKKKDHIHYAFLFLMTTIFCGAPELFCSTTTT
jgi:asparagine N-glycosylation enzyme membrane subunit Stt3